MDSVVPFLIALLIGRQNAVVVAEATGMPYWHTLALTAAFFFTLACVLIGLSHIPWLAEKLHKLQRSRWGRWTTQAVRPGWRIAVVIPICLLPAGPLLALAVMAIWRFRVVTQVILTTIGGTVSYAAYGAAMAPFLDLLGVRNVAIAIVLTFVMSRVLRANPFLLWKAADWLQTGTGPAPRIYRHTCDRFGWSTTR
ncbi:MAG: hypothetical protein M3N59_03560 [bacterium]|nr:hypothetical protein [bacterium]